MDLVVIDGPNLYNTVASRCHANEDLTKLYLEEHFDIDQLVLASLNDGYPGMGIVIFHSRKPLGRASYYLTDRKTEAFWARQGSNPNTSTFTVDVPGDQQETYSFNCDHCGHLNEASTRSEKGIDTSITTYLMETLDSWKSVCLFSRDVDYAPLVAALRRKGKLVYVAVPTDEKPTALVRVAQSTISLKLLFIMQDLAATQYLMPGGVLDDLIAMLSDHKDFHFAVDLAAEHLTPFISLGITHSDGAHDHLCQLVSPLLQKLACQIVMTEKRNSRLTILKIYHQEPVARKLSKFISSSIWSKHLGDMHLLHAQIVEGGK